MSYEIEIQVAVDAPDEAIPAIELAVGAALEHLESPDGSGVTIVLADDHYLQRLNRQFRQENHPTDVLSFPAGDPIPGQGEPLDYLGDIAISVPYAQHQAAAQGHGLIEELQLLAVHGVLHLLGYDHATADEKEAMWSQQQHILNQLGLGHIQPTEGESGA